jgi:ribonuclease E
MKKEMLINVLQPEEIRIAIVEDGVLEELYVERTSHESYVGNIYKGRIVNIEPSIQAAFVDFGVGRNGFLHVSDVEPAYYRHLEGYGDDRGRRSPRDRHRTGEHERRGRGPRPAIDDRMEELEDLEDERYEMPETDVVDPGEGLAPAEQGLVPFDDEHDIEVQELGAEGMEDADASGVTGRYLPPPEAPLLSSDETELDDPLQPPPTAVEDRGTELEPPPSDADPDSAAGTEAGHEEHEHDKPRRGRRRRGQRRSKAAEESGESGAPRDDHGPRLMESSERRTDEDDAPLDPIEPGPTFSDEELSFSMGGQPASAPRPQPHSGTRREEPAGRAEPLTPAEMGFEDVSDEPVTEEFVQQEMDFGAPRGEILDRPLHEEHELPGEPLPPDDFQPIAEEIELGAPYEDYAPPPRRERGDRGDRGERGDRGDRGGRDRGRDRGDRGDRRGPPRGRGGPRMGGRPGMGRPKPPIQEIFKRGQEVLVQVIKEGIGTKGPTLSTYISIAGRYLVLMPGLNRIGVSRKIADDNARRRLRQIMQELQPPRGIGFIIRTAGIDRDKKELQRDLLYLAKLWQVVVRRIKKLKSPAAVYQESDMVTRTIRDIFTGDIDTIWVDEKESYEHAKEFLQIVMPRYASRIKLYDENVPMFHKYGIEQEINRIQQRHVPLPNGGSIVIDQTEALVAIDVNSGSFRADNNAEATAFQMNLQAAREIARQLRLRDLGGVIVNDFIDMRDEKHRRGVERALRDAMRRDRARTKMLRMSQFGIIEMTRQRIRPSLKRSAFQECPHCSGTGHVKTCESVSIEVMRLLQLAAHRDYINRLEVGVHEQVAHYLLNRKRGELARLEEASGKQILVRIKPNVAPELVEFLSFDANNNEVKFLPFDEPKVIRPRRERGERGERGGRGRGDRERGDRGDRERGDRGRGRGDRD